MNLSDIIFDPLLPWPVIWAGAIATGLILMLTVWRRLSGWAWRALAGAMILTGLTNPSLQFAEREPLPDVVLVVSDVTASQRIADRASETEAARAALVDRLARLENVQVREVSVAEAPDDGGSRVMSRVATALADIPRDQLAGVFVLSDGQVHDADAAPALPAPMHLLLSGQDEDWDRRLVIRQAPAFAILGEPVTLTVAIEDQGAVPNPAPPAEISVSVDGGAPMRIPALGGDEVELEIELPHGGLNIVHVSTPMQEGELTDRNNAAIVQINGLRDRLSVLLVSGEPHPGGRTWRNLLKSDSAVDLVHFTILRPPEKQDGVPVGELSLIAFPTRELFLEKIDEFDLIIFDRYKRRGILPNAYLENIRSYVEEGGALLLAAGPEFGSANSLFHTAIGDIMPAAPTGRVFEVPFSPMISEIGRRHPVTSGLAGPEPEWGRWLRVVETEPLAGHAVLSGPNDLPLLVLDRVGDGRVALLASDQAWLWARGYEGGGPQLELLRRLAHWMMQEPELEEEALSVQAEGNRMTITRRSLTNNRGVLTITRPDGSTEDIQLSEVSPGQLMAQYDGPELGLYRITDGSLTTVAALGPSAPKEFEETIAAADKLQPAIDAAGGGSFRLSEGLPSIRSVPEGRRAFGRAWAAITPRDASQTVALRVQPLLPAWLALLLAAGLAVAGWLREGRR